MTQHQPSSSIPRRRPVLLYDGECPFCRRQVERLGRWVGDRFETRTLQYEYGPGDIPDEMKLRLPDGREFGGAQAAARLLWLRPAWRLVVWIYFVPGIRQIANWAYRWVAANRQRFSVCGCSDETCSRHVDHQSVESVAARAGSSTYRRSAKVFLFVLSVLYLVSFLSLYTQIIPLGGSNGLIPAEETLERFRQVDTPESPNARLWRYPTLFWWGHSDGLLRGGCIVGMALAVLSMAGVFRWTCMVLMGVLYLSYVQIGSVFYFFQWDNLQLETTLHALLLPAYSIPLIFRSPERRLKAAYSPPHPITVFLMQWLLFRVYFESGLAKVLAVSGGWRDLTAMDAYYNTAPLATWVGWYAHNMPPWWHQWETGLTLLIELILPVFIFAGRGARAMLFLVFTGFQIAILLTGNYGLFNYLTLILGLFLLDDRHYDGVVRFGRWVGGLIGRARSPAGGDRVYVPGFLAWGVRTLALVIAAAAILPASLIEMSGLFLDRSTRSELFHNRQGESKPLATFCEAHAGFRVVNRYHLFAGMTRERIVPQIQGLDENGVWRTYPWAYAPGDPLVRPRILAPFHPRLDFHVWFVGLAQPNQVPRRYPYFMRLLQILRDDPSRASEYFLEDPFADSRPRRLRVMGVRYDMSPPEVRSETGAWWVMKETGVWFREIEVPASEPASTQPVAE